MKNLYVDLHILQDVPPSNINRDENGTPKQAIYGGVGRLRVSSQAWKRATRMAFIDDMGKENGGVRTRRLVALLSDELQARGVERSQAETAATAACRSLGIKPGAKASDLAYLLFFGRRQLAEIADRTMTKLDQLVSLSGKELESVADEIGVKSALGEGHPLDVALFGRMVADLAGLNVDAATQVAHALSTHAAQTEFDYFTAVDDQQPNDETGAGMIGMVEFNSATLYRYATVGVGQLMENLGDKKATVDGVRSFIRHFALSMPAGHKTSFAPRTRPAFVAVVVRDDQPVNLVSAFECPVRPKGGTMAPSILSLAKFARDEAVRWGDEPLLMRASYQHDDQVVAEVFGESQSLEAILDAVAAQLDDRLSDDD